MKVVEACKLKAIFHMLWTGIRAGFGGKGGPGLAASFSQKGTAKAPPSVRLVCSCTSAHVRNVTEALATCRCFRPTYTSGNSAAAVVDKLMTDRQRR